MKATSCAREVTRVHAAISEPSPATMCSLNRKPRRSRKASLFFVTFEQSKLTWSRRRTGIPCAGRLDRKSTRLNSSHMSISYAVFCLKKKKKNKHCRHILNTANLHTLHQ